MGRTDAAELRSVDAVVTALSSLFCIGRQNFFEDANALAPPSVTTHLCLPFSCLCAVRSTTVLDALLRGLEFSGGDGPARAPAGALQNRTPPPRCRWRGSWKETELRVSCGAKTLTEKRLCQSRDRTDGSYLFSTGKD